MDPGVKQPAAPTAAGPSPKLLRVYENGTRFDEKIEPALMIESTDSQTEAATLSRVVYPRSGESSEAAKRRKHSCGRKPQIDGPPPAAPSREAATAIRTLRRFALPNAWTQPIRGADAHG